MEVGIRWLVALCLMVQVLVIETRVIDDDQEVYGGLSPREDPYEEDLFEEDRYEDPMMSDQPQPAESPAHTQEVERPYRACSSPADCYPDECCRIGMQRFSEPSCTKLGNEGDFCRVDQEPFNTTLNYPDGSSKDLSNGYVLFCPCTEGLTCLRAYCRPYKELYLMDKSQENTL